MRGIRTGYRGREQGEVWVPSPISNDGHKAAATRHDGTAGGSCCIALPCVLPMPCAHLHTTRMCACSLSAREMILSAVRIGPGIDDSQFRKGSAGWGEPYCPPGTLQRTVWKGFGFGMQLVGRPDHEGDSTNPMVPVSFQAPISWV
jgi:hypothetical protein